MELQKVSRNGQLELAAALKTAFQNRGHRYRLSGDHDVVLSSNRTLLCDVAALQRRRRNVLSPHALVSITPTRSAEWCSEGPRR